MTEKSKNAETIKNKNYLSAEYKKDFSAQTTT